MKYMKQYKEIGAKPFEIPKEEARLGLCGYWVEEALDDIFDNERAFRLFTPVAEYWTVDEEGLVPMAGFYGIIC